MAQSIQKPAPNPLPITTDELEARRKFYHQPTLNDRVDAYHVKLWENADYRHFLDGVYDEQCVEGSQYADNLEAAAMIREMARAEGDKYVGGLKKATISKALNVVCHRYGISRQERAREVAGQIVDRSSNQQPQAAA
jgi:hypothetical protein